MKEGGPCPRIPQDPCGVRLWGSPDRASSYKETVVLVLRGLCLPDPFGLQLRRARFFDRVRITGCEQPDARAVVVQHRTMARGSGARDSTTMARGGKTWCSCPRAIFKT